MQEPWYRPIPEAAKAAGISERQLREYVNSDDPPARLMQGSKVTLNMEKLKKYLEAKEI